MVLSSRPYYAVLGWAALALAVGCLAPNLTRLAAEGQGRLMGDDVESRRAADVVRQAWPDQSHESLAVAVLYRAGGLTEADLAYAASLEARFERAGRPEEVLRVLGPASAPEIAERLVSRDRTVAMVAAPMSSSFVLPATHEAVAWLQAQAVGALAPPSGLELGWTGDAVIGRDYMAGVQTSLDRAALATVVLLLAVLLFVYRSIWLALVPIVTIATSLVVARGVLGWMTSAGWEVSPLVELFLVAVLFGSGTDFCLFISWRFAENWDPADPVGAMDRTLRGSALALLTSAGTVIVGLLLMGTTRFRLFSSTGPSVAIGLALSLAATLTLTPALLVLLARHRPRSFAGLLAPASGLWERIGALAMRRPAVSWAATLLLMVPLALLSMRAHVVQDLLSELPGATPSKQTFRRVSEAFGAGVSSPLTVVLESDADLRSSEGLALIDDVSRFLSRQRRLAEVRSATQPLGSPDLLKRARIGSRMGELNDGFGQLSAGAAQLEQALNQGLARLRAALWLERKTGLALTGPSSAKAPAGSANDPREAMANELARAAEGAGKIAEGARRARAEVGGMLDDPVGRRAFDRLLINDETVRQNPDLHQSFAAYITPDGHRARLDLTQSDRVFSAGAMDEVVTLRRRLNEFLADADGPRVQATIAGANAESADVRAMTRADQFQSWFVIPLGVFLVLLVALRNPLTCLNLVATMLLTYAFALGATHLLFVVGLGAEGIDWKVPYFLFVLLVAVGVDYNVFLMASLNEETHRHGLRAGIVRAVGQTGGLITSAAAITACSFASFMSSPLGSLRQLGFALVVGIAVDAVLVRPLLVPCGHWLLNRRRAKCATVLEPRHQPATTPAAETTTPTPPRGPRRHEPRPISPGQNSGILPALSS